MRKVSFMVVHFESMVLLTLMEWDQTWSWTDKKIKNSNR